ncbi:MAG: thioredoxin [Bacteroidales bacterium]|nr:thioredoxin [Bacteroidales bacterium]
MQTAIIITLSVLAIYFLLMFVARARMKNVPLVEDHAKIITLTDKNFSQQAKNRLLLVDFWAAWCAPCRMMAPILNEIAEEMPNNAHIGKVNIEQYQSLAQKFKVRGIPTMILFKNGVEINRFVGVKNKEFLLKQLKNT